MRDTPHHPPLHSHTRTPHPRAHTHRAPSTPHAPRLQAYDAAGAYAFGSSAAAQRATELHQQAHEARAKRWLGRSTVRSFSPGQRFTLAGSMLDALDAGVAYVGHSGFKPLGFYSLGF